MTQASKSLGTSRRRLWYHSHPTLANGADTAPCRSDRTLSIDRTRVVQSARNEWTIELDEIRLDSTAWKRSFRSLSKKYVRRTEQTLTASPDCPSRKRRPRFDGRSLPARMVLFRFLVAHESIGHLVPS